MNSAAIGMQQLMTLKHMSLLARRRPKNALQLCLSGMSASWGNHAAVVIGVP
jgi:hypothetical protein